MYSRSKQFLQLARMCGRKRCCIALFALVCSCAFTYFTFYQATNAYAEAPSGSGGNAHGNHGSVNFNWFKQRFNHQRSSSLGYSDDKNVVSREFNFVVKVLAYNRLHSLRRCLRSLAAADYGGDTVPLVVFVDHLKPRSTLRRLFSESSMESGSGNDTSGTGSEPEVAVLESDLDLGLARRMLDFLDEFEWPHGSKEVVYRSKNLGLQGQWIEAWWPSSDHQFALVVEDDMQLSPLYYRYVRSIVANYYYNVENYDPSIFGITLQRPRFVAGKGGRSLKVENSTRLFLYQMVGSWGQVLFPRPWKEFRLWFDEQKARGRDPILGGMTTSGWYRKLGDKIWTPWFVKFAYSRGYFNLYTNFLEQRALSVSHRSKGVNYKEEAGPDSTLIMKKGVEDINLWEMPPLMDLKWYDFCFEEVLRGRVVNTTLGLGQVLPRVQSEGSVVIVAGVNVTEGTMRNWLCQLSSLGMKNYLVVVDDTVVAKELARRGHPVMVVDVDDAGIDQSYVRVVHQVLKLGYDVWFARPNRVWLKLPLDQMETSKVDMLAADVGDEEYYTGLFFVSSTDKSMGALAKCLKHDLQGSFGEKLWRAGVDLKLLVGRLEQSGSGEKFLMLDGQQDVKELGLWLVDEELACKRVHCSVHNVQSRI